MTAPNLDSFNGSTVTWANISLGKLRSITFANKAAKVKVSAAGDTQHTYEAGLPDPEVTLEIVGTVAATIYQGQKGPLVVTWKGTGTSGSITNGLLLEIDSKGSMDGEVTSTLKIVPSTASGT